MTTKEKQEYTLLRYTKTNDTLQMIADKVGVHVNTISRWKEKFSWDKFRKSLLVTRGEQIRRLYDQLDALTYHISNKPEGKRFANKSEADSLTQITRSIANLEKDLTSADVINVFIPFVTYVAKIDGEKAKEFIEFQDSYIKTLSK